MYIVQGGPKSKPLLMRWSSMLVFTVMQSHTRVDIVQKVSDAEGHLSYICWSQTMKELVSCGTFVTRNSVGNVILSDTYSDVKVWSRMLAMNVKSVSVQQTTWGIISWCTPTLKAFAVVCVERILSVHMQLNATLSGVLMVSNVTVFYEKKSFHAQCLLFI